MTIASDVPYAVPASVTAGDRVQWARTIADYVAPTWVLSYRLSNAAGAITLTGTADGSTHVIDVAAASTALWAPGKYAWQEYVTNGTDRRTLTEGAIEIRANFASAAAYDGRSHARRVLDAIEAVLERRATKDQEEYAIAGRSLRRTPTADLLVLRDRYRAEVLREGESSAAASGLRRVHLRFARV